MIWIRTEITEDSMKEVTLRPTSSDGWDLKKWDWKRGRGREHEENHPTGKIWDVFRKNVISCLVCLEIC